MWPTHLVVLSVGESKSKQKSNQNKIKTTISKNLHCLTETFCSRLLWLLTIALKTVNTAYLTSTQASDVIALLCNTSLYL